MKYIGTLLALTLSMGIVTAQSIEITYTPTGNDVSNTTVNVSGGHLDPDIKAAFTVTNTSGSDMDIKIKRYETSVLANTLNYFCWYVCYGTDTAGNFPVFPVPGSPQDVNHAVSVMAGQTSLNPFEAHHLPEGFIGTSCYRYVAYDGNNTNDSTYVDICYNIGFTNIANHEVSNLSQYPNPANNEINIEFDINSSTHDETELSIYSTSGKLVRSLTTASDRFVVSTSELPAGLYLYTLVKNGVVLTNHKFTVQH